MHLPSFVRPVFNTNSVGQKQVCDRVNLECNKVQVQRISGPPQFTTFCSRCWWTTWHNVSHPSSRNITLTLLIPPRMSSRGNDEHDDRFESRCRFYWHTDWKFYVLFKEQGKLFFFFTLSFLIFTILNIYMCLEIGLNVHTF